MSEKVTYAESVSYLADAGILRGTASGGFAPNEKITVSQWATMLCRAFDTEPEGVSWQEVGANAVQIAIRSGWLEPTAISDANGLICRGELYRTAFAAAGIPLYDATLYGLDWLSSGENALRVGKELGLCAENKTAADLITRAEAAQLLHAVLTQTLTVITPDTPITVENLTQWNVNTFLLELRKVPQPILDAFNENGFICRGELYRTVFAAAGIPLYDATLYSLDWLSPGENALRVGKKLGLCAENKTAAELVTRAEAAQLLHAVLTQNLTVTPPDTPVTVENLIQWNVNAFLLELCKVPQPILDAFNENGWTFVIGTEYLADLSRKLGVNCIGAAAYTEKRIYVFEASAILHEFGHFLDCTMGFPQEHNGTRQSKTL